MVGKAGLEPARLWHENLNLACLPISPLARFVTSREPSLCCGLAQGKNDFFLFFVNYVWLKSGFLTDLRRV